MAPVIEALCPQDVTPRSLARKIRLLMRGKNMANKRISIFSENIDIFCGVRVRSNSED